MNGKHEHEKVNFETYLEKVYDHALKMRKTFRESQKVKKEERELKIKKLIKGFLWWSLGEKERWQK